MEPISTVDKGIPIPTRSPRECRYPWVKMTKVGDSFLVPRDSYTEEGNIRASIGSSFKTWAKRWAKGKFKITVHKVPEGLRCWRVK